MKNDSYTPEQMVAAIRTANYSRGPLNAEQIQFITEEESSRHTASLIDLRSQLDVERNPERRADLERDIAHHQSELDFWRSKASPGSTSTRSSVSPPAPATPPPPAPPPPKPSSLTEQFIALRRAEDEGTKPPGSAMEFWRANRESIDQERKAARIAAGGGVLIGKSVIYKSAPAVRLPPPSKADPPTPLSDEYMALRKSETEKTAAPGSAFAFWQANSGAIAVERAAAKNGGTLTQARNGKALIFKL